MMSMNVWKRATLAIVRKPVRSGIIGLLMLMVFTSLVAQVGVSTALRTMSDGIGAGMGIGFTVSAGENPISAEEASRFSHIPGVTKTAYATKTLAQVDGARPVMPRQGPRLDSDLAMQVSVLGTTDSSLSEEFQGGLYRLEQGRHISGDGDDVLVHRDFALQNGLSVGSTFRLRQEGAQRHGACGRDLLRQRAGPKPPALGHFREPHLFGQASGLRSDRKRPDRHDPMPVG